MSEFDERPVAEIMAELAKYDSNDLIKAAQNARTPITAETLCKVLREVISPVLGQYVKELRGKIADLTTRMVALEAENEQLHAKMALLSEQRRRVRPIANVNERIARIERQIEEAEDGGD